MFESIENIKLLDVIAGQSSLYHTNHERTSHGFVFKISGASQYEFGNKTILLKEGEMIYIPKGSSYTVRRTTNEDSQFVALCFDATIKNTEPRLYPIHHFTDIKHICTNLVHLWLFRSLSDEYKCISIFYDILSGICEADKKEYRSSRQCKIIEPAVDYLKAHIFDSSLKAHELHLFCGISDTYFRKIFISQFGTSPQKYIINKRLTQAKTIIDNGDFNTISDVAASVGYEDALYFSRAFRNKYGVSPTKIVDN